MKETIQSLGTAMTTYQLNKTVVERLQNLLEEIKRLQRGYDETIYIALEAIGAVEGQIQSINLDSGEVGVKPNKELEDGLDHPR